MRSMRPRRSNERPDGNANASMSCNGLSAASVRPVWSGSPNATSLLNGTTPSAARRALSVAQNASIIVYPEAPHGFHADYRPSYRETEAKAAWKELLTWFKKNGVA